MKVRIEPTVYLTHVQQTKPDAIAAYLLEIGKPFWGTDTKDPASVAVEIGGRVCYQSFGEGRPGGNAAYIHHIKEVGHGSVLEHASYTFIVTGVSRSLTHELVRHRAGMAYSQLSQRYVDETAAEYVCPLAIRNDPVAFAIWKDAVQHSHDAYVKLVNHLMSRLKEEDKPGEVIDRTARRKACRGAARSVLPNATETKIQVTANARALRHMIEQRASEHADEEIRRMAYAMWVILVNISPNVFGDYIEKRLDDGTISLSTETPKV